MINVSDSISFKNDLETEDVFYPELSDFYQKHFKHMIVSHLNINSLRNKFLEISQVVNYCDILCLSETKLNDSFPSSQFSVPNYRILRNDRNEHGGGILCYVKSSIPCRPRHDVAYNVNGIESIVMEIASKRGKCFVVCIYRPPSVPMKYLVDSLNNICNQCYLESKSLYIMGDLNVNFMSSVNGLSDTLTMLNLSNMIQGPTCHKNVHSPTLLDVFLTNCKKSVSSTFNIDIGLSDFHNVIGFATKMFVPDVGMRKISYRSYKHYDEDLYKNDLTAAPFHICEIFDDVDDMVWVHNKLLSDIIDTHAPRKVKCTKGQTAFYMNNALRKEINYKAMLKRKFNKQKTSESWSKFKHQRNKVNKLKRVAIRSYFDRHCNTNASDKRFWQTVKPFFSNKVKDGSCQISLLDEHSNIVSDKRKVCNMFNDYFTNICDSLCESDDIKMLTFDNLINCYKDHASIQQINNKLVSNLSCFDFHNVNQSDVLKKLCKIQTNKSCGFDNLPAKLIKSGAEVLCMSFTPIVNNIISTQTFPALLKCAEISPIYKKGDNLKKSNYRPVSVLTILSKIAEGMLCDQLLKHFSDVLSKYLSAYRKGYSCENVLIKCIEDWRAALDNNEVVGTILIDLSKAFDSLPHGLLIAKLYAYGLSEQACHLIMNYLSGRCQRVKMQNTASDWQIIKRGVPQGSLMGPLLFNIFLNDIFLFFDDDVSIYNYADDNTLSYHHPNPTKVKNVLESAVNTSLQWFEDNFMEANPDKFQCMVLSRDKDININFSVNGRTLNNEVCVKLLGVHIDKDLTFNYHIENICKKAAKQVNAMCRMSKYLNQISLKTVFHSFIISNFNYCSLAWHICGLMNTRKVEKLQKRALRIVYGDYSSSYEMLLRKSNSCSLYVSRLRKLIVFVHKVLKNDCKPISPGFFEVSDHSYGTRSCANLRQDVPKSVRFGVNSLKHQGVIAWNAIPNNIRCKENVTDIKSSLSSWNGFKCTCGFCINCTILRL